jgi:hypothetical protein
LISQEMTFYVIIIKIVGSRTLEVEYCQTDQGQVIYIEDITCVCKVFTD